MTRRLPALLAFATVALLGSACAGSSSDAATVGESAISIDRLERDMILFEFLTGLSGAPCGTPAPFEGQDAACARFTLSNDIREELAKAYAVDHELSVEPSVVNDALAQLETNIGGAEALDARLAEADLMRSDLRAFAERVLLINVVQEAVVAERVDDEALRAQYDDQLDAFTTLEVAHILVEDQADAERIAAEVTPETFEQVARRESADPGSAQNGGSLGSFSEPEFIAQFDPDFVAGALELEPGEISGPVQTQFGWHVIRLVSRDVASFEDVRERLRAGSAGQVFEDWMLEQLDTTDIDVNPRFGRLDTETGEVRAVRSTADEGEQPAGATAP
ncbi:MAG TPA: peptidylprolyl isomerase [Actinomycetota bacterium]|nr:peptidylprolyl isomerase [Actinomycetota bacterium]